MKRKVARTLSTLATLHTTIRAGAHIEVRLQPVFLCREFFAVPIFDLPSFLTSNILSSQSVTPLLLRLKHVVQALSAGCSLFPKVQNASFPTSIFVFIVMVKTMTDSHRLLFSLKSPKTTVICHQWGRILQVHFPGREAGEPCVLDLITKLSSTT